MKDHSPEQVRKYSKSHEANKYLYEEMAELLQQSGHEKKHQRNEWMAVSNDTDVYLETVETDQNENGETNRAGSSQPLCGNNCL